MLPSFLPNTFSLWWEPTSSMWLNLFYRRKQESIKTVWDTKMDTTWNWYCLNFFVWFGELIVFLSRPRIFEEGMLSDAEEETDFITMPPRIINGAMSNLSRLAKRACPRSFPCPLYSGAGLAATGLRSEEFIIRVLPDGLVWPANLYHFSKHY